MAEKWRDRIAGQETDEFYELVLQPEYRRLILLYYSLCKVSGIKVKE